MLSLQIAIKDLKGGFRRLVIFLLAIIIGVSAIASVQIISSSVKSALKRDAKLLLGGDIEVSQLYASLSDEELAYVKTLGEVSLVSELRTNARANGRTSLIELKVVDGNYPLIGKVELVDKSSLKEVLKAGKVVIADDLSTRLNVSVGNALNIAGNNMVIGAIIKKLPDVVSDIFVLGPKVLMSQETFKSTVLSQPGSLIKYRYRILLKEEYLGQDMEAKLKARFPKASWRIRNYQNINPSLNDNIQNLTMFFAFAALSALLTGGIAISSSVTAYLNRKQNIIAILKTLGAPGNMIAKIFFAELLIIGILGLLLGIILGLGFAMTGIYLSESFIPFKITPVISLDSIILVAVLGVLTIIGFSYIPIAQSTMVSPTSLFRGVITNLPKAKFRHIIITSLIALLLAVSILVFSHVKILGLWFIIGTFIASFSFYIFAKIFLSIIKHIKPSNPVINFALRNLLRPGSGTIPITIALGLGLTVLITVSLINSIIERQVSSSLPRQAPTHFFIDIPSMQKDYFQEYMEKIADTANFESMPMVRGNISKIKGKEAKESDINPEARWALRSERGLTFASTPPKGTVITEGSWWPENYNGPALISMDENLAKNMGLKIGDSLTYNVLGEEIEGKIANLRKVEYQRFTINFATIFSSGALDHLPYSYLATIRADSEDAEKNIEAVISEKFQFIVMIKVKDALDDVSGLIKNFGIAIRVVAFMTVIAGILALTGAITATQERRIYDNTVLKVLGATKRYLTAIYLIEFFILGIAILVISSILSIAATYSIISLFRLLEFYFSLKTLVAVATTVFFMVIGIAYAENLRILKVRPAFYLRNE